MLLKNDIKETISNLKEWARPIYTNKTLVTLFDTPVIYHEPYGVVLVS